MASAYSLGCTAMILPSMAVESDCQHHVGSMSVAIEAHDRSETHSTQVRDAHRSDGFLLVAGQATADLATLASCSFQSLLRASAEGAVVLCLPRTMDPSAEAYAHVPLTLPAAGAASVVLQDSVSGPI